MLAPAAAWADPGPQVVTLTPEAGSSRRSPDVPDVRATYDRDLSEQSTLILSTGSGAVAGVTQLGGQRSGTLGYRTIVFRPSLPLAEGLYTVAVHAIGVIPGDESRDEWRFTVDDTAPAAPVLTYPSGPAPVRDQPVLLRGNAEPGAVLLVSEAGTVIAQATVPTNGVFAITLPYPPEDGVTHTLTARARDSAGNASDASSPLTFVHDSVVSIPVILSPSEGAALAASLVRVRGQAKPNTTLTLHEGSTPIGSTTVGADGWWQTDISFAEGTHTITASSWDGWTTDGPSEPRTFRVDLTLPAKPAIALPSEGQHLAVSAVAVTGTAEPRASVRIRDAGALRATVAVDAAGDWSAVIPFTDGTHTLTAQAVDAAGNAGPLSDVRTFVVDTAAPAPPTIEAPAEGTAVSTAAVTIAGRAEAGATVDILHGTALIATTTVDGTGGWVASHTFADGAYTIAARARDAAGNVSLESPRSFTVDTVAPPTPVITTPPEGANLPLGRVRIAGTAEQAALVVVSEGSVTLGTAPADVNGAWAVEVPMPTGPHTVTAVARDNAGNSSAASAPRSFVVTTTAPPGGGDGDTTPPAAPTIVHPMEGSTTRGEVRFSGQAEPGATVIVDEAGDGLASTTASMGGDWELSVSMSAGSHVVTAYAMDRARNIGPPSPARSFEVDASRPTVQLDTVDGTLFLPGEQVAITGSANDDRAVVRIELEYFDVTGRRVLRQDAAECPACGSISTTWKATPTLPPNAYRVDAYAIDAGGNRSIPASIDFYRL